METTMVTPEMQEAKLLEAKGTEMERVAARLEIVDNPTYEKAGAILLQVQEMRDNTMIIPLKRKEEAHRVHAFMSDICKMVLAPFTRTEAILDRKMTEYRNEVKRQMKEQQDKDDALARAEAQKKREKEIADAKKLGDKEGAKNLAKAPIIPEYRPPTIVEPPKIKGVTIRKIWDFRIVDENKIPRKYFKLDEATIGKLVRALGENHGIPGVQAFQKEVQ